MTDADLQDPNGEQTEAEEPANPYKVVASAPESPDEKLTAAGLRDPIGTGADEKTLNAAQETPIPSPAPPKANPIRVYVVIGVGLGVLFGVVIAAVSWFAGSPEEPHDFGSFTSSAAGLKGHLFTKWDKKLEYHLTLEPGDPEQQAGFALAVANPPRPLSIEIRLLDSQGFVLCSKGIVLRYDARNAAALGASNPDFPAGKTDADNASNGQLAQANDELLDAQEAARELGKDVFQNQIGADRQIAAINAQGEIPCSEKAYGKTSSWSFSPNFPSLAEQDELLKRQEEARANAELLPSQASAARKKIAAKTAVKLLPFSIEGDDAIVEFDASHGIIETRGRKTFFFDKTSGAGADSNWQDYPVSIHYKCDRSSDCVLMHAGAGALRARLRR